MCLVAAPTAITSTPVASGSSVPACPTLYDLPRPMFRRTCATASIELIRKGLSMTKMPDGPETCGLGAGIGMTGDRATFRRFGVLAFCPFPHTLGDSHRTGVRAAEGAALEMPYAGFPASWVRIPPCPLFVRGV